MALSNSKTKAIKKAKDITQPVNQKKNTFGRWSKKEHLKFIEGLEKFGKNWKKVIIINFYPISLIDRTIPGNPIWRANQISRLKVFQQVDNKNGPRGGEKFF